MRPLLTALLLLPFPAFSAPAPVYREKPLPCVVPGTHTLHWSGTPWRMTLDAEGRYESVREGCPRYYGSWAWCPMRRIFAIHETIDGQVWRQWTITLDAKLSGKADQVGCPEVRVEPLLGKRKGK